jgi:hypothetical protein
MSWGLCYTYLPIFWYDSCYGLNVYVYLKFLCGSSNLQWRQRAPCSPPNLIFQNMDAQEGGALMNMISALRQEIFLSLPLPLCAMWSYKKRPFCKLGKGPSPGTESAGILMLDFQHSELWETNVSCLRDPVYSICYSSQAKTIVNFRCRTLSNLLNLLNFL